MTEEIVEEKSKTEVVEVKVEEAPVVVAMPTGKNMDGWNPRTTLGKQVKSGSITSLKEILDKGLNIMEASIVDFLLPDLESDLLAIGQSKGKFGGGKRSIWKQVQKKTAEGNKPKFATYVVVGNKDGYVGIGYGKAKETVPAREKALRNSKLNIIQVIRGCGSWECGCGTSHSIPFKVKGKCGSVEVFLMPAPKGTGLIVENECKKILSLAGIQDIYSSSFGQTRTKTNIIKACFDALINLSKVKVKEDYYKRSGMLEGK